jgi:hypothetical protein
MHKKPAPRFSHTPGDKFLQHPRRSCLSKRTVVLLSLLAFLIVGRTGGLYVSNHLFDERIAQSHMQATAQARVQATARVVVLQEKN